MAAYTDLALFRRVLRHTRAYWLHMLALFTLTLLASPIALLTPLPLKIAVDSLIGSRPLPRPLDMWLPPAVTGSPTALLLFVVGLLAAVTLLGQAQQLAAALLGNYVKEKMILDFRTYMFRHLQRISLSYHDSKGTADSVYRIQHDVPDIQQVVTESAIPFVSASITLVGMIYVMGRIDWQLALIAIAISPPLIVTARFFRRRLRRQSREAKKLDSSALGIVQEVLGALRIVKAFGQEAREEQRYLRRGGDVMRARMRQAFMEGEFNVFVGLTTAAGTAAVLFIGLSHVRANALTLGQLLMVMSYLNQLYAPLKTVSRKAASLQANLVAAERAFAVLDQPPDVIQRPGARPLTRATGAIAFRNVSFAYSPDRRVLQDILFTIEPGTRLGIAGASGAGKSTLISLLTRFYDPTEGEIRLDGVDVRDYRLDDLRLQFAVVPQDPVLFSTSIAENIAYARPGASEREVIAAAQAANAHEFIVRFPHGYQTQVGERGVQLSGGQRQRIAIARAFLKDSPVLILDEPTSAVDQEAETAIVDAVQRLMRGRTVILITHRPQLLERCSALIVLEHGRLASSTTLSPALSGTPAAPTPVAERRASLMRHPAVVAWCRLHPNAEPLRITPLKVRRKKNQVYRLDGIGWAGAPVIAKRCPKAVALVERTVYEEILPRTAVPSLHHYGFIEEPDGEYSWLFMEEATGADYSNLLADHRALAARWLGLLHSAAADAAAAARLPDASPGRYLDLLQATRELIHQHLDNPVLSADDVVRIEEIRARLDDLAAHWSRVEAVCGPMPQTLVHGDFTGKNIRLRPADGDTAVVVFDWEHAGWGTPAVDLAQLTVPSHRLSANPDISTYWSTVRERWPDVSLEAWRQLAYCGTVCRTLSALYWDAHNLTNDWAQSFVRSMQTYVIELDGALEQLGWGSGAAAARRQAVGT